MKDDARDSKPSPITFLPPANAACGECGRKFIREWNMLEPLELRYATDEASAEFRCHCGMPVVGWSPATPKDVADAIWELLDRSCPVKFVCAARGQDMVEELITPFPEPGAILPCSDSIN